MSMGYGANHAHIIFKEGLVQISEGVKKLTNELYDLLEDDLTMFSFDIEFEADELEEELYKKAEIIYQKLQKQFEKDTGLELYLGHHNSDDNGSRYDAIDGPFWYLYGYAVISEAGEKIKEHVEEALWVTYG